jgi:hypothetical protein
MQRQNPERHAMPGARLRKGKFLAEHQPDLARLKERGERSPQPVPAFERWKAKQSPGVIDELALPDIKGLELPELPGLELPDMPSVDELPDNANRCDKIL